VLPVLAGFDAEGRPDGEVATRVARAWRAGGLVGLPTETVYGLSADAQDPEAVARVYRAKGRPADHPVIVHVHGPQALTGWAGVADPAAERLAQAFWPGPLTLVVVRGPRAGDFVTGGQSTVALRCPDHPVALACLEALGRESGDSARGVAAPSANRFGRVSPTRAADVVAELGDRLDPTRDLVIDGGECRVGVESTIVDCSAGSPRVLRPGAVSQAQIDAALADAGLAPPTPAGVDLTPARPGLEAPTRAPGTLDSHYAPHARVVLASDGLVRSAGRGRDQAGGEGTVGGSGTIPRAWHDLAPAQVGLLAEPHVATPPGWVRLASPDGVEQYARVLYAALRAADRRGLELVVAVPPDPSGGALAHAVRDRLARAAHGG